MFDKRKKKKKEKEEKEKKEEELRILAAEALKKDEENEESEIKNLASKILKIKKQVKTQREIVRKREDQLEKEKSRNLRRATSDVDPKDLTPYIKAIEAEEEKLEKTEDYYYDLSETAILKYPKYFKRQ